MLDELRGRLVPADVAAERYDLAFAAVAVLLRGGDGLEVLLTERAKREDDPWSGQWSFPGGRRGKGEPLLDTARRETEEEVGLGLDPSTVIGCLDARPPANRPEMLVLPFVFLWEGAAEPAPGPEVAQAAWFPIRELRESRSEAFIRVRNFERTMPAYVHGGRTIWGFTYRALEDLMRRLG